ncbi:response regulator transcription factor [bacterium]|jgi:DNA-binding response OmpR family regulator|nr:response regulator transcription factor [Rubripirellula sp.]MDC0317275.1 response regulator transcription factor [bacterium]
MAAPGILTIEDDPAIRRGIVDSLKATGHIVWQADRADTGIEKAIGKPCDLVLLDLVLPGGHGLDVLTEIRSQKPTLPVIILTAKGEEQDRIKGLRLGADDYVVKPFSVDELLARVEAVLRRSPARSAQNPSLTLPNGEINWNSRELTSNTGLNQVLSERECDLLNYLSKNPDRAIDRNELLQGVWQIDSKGVTTRTVDMHIARLREKLSHVCGDKEAIKTVRGKGYMIESELVKTR